jgi:peroxiredoxin
MGVERSTFIVDAEGVIAHADYKVKAPGDAVRALDLLP